MQFDSVLTYFWSLNGDLKFCKVLQCFVICRKVRVVLMTKILCFDCFQFCLIKVE
jgi:hypothetical protein